MMGANIVSYGDLALCALLIVTVRMVLQLSLVGVVLKSVFALQLPCLVAVVVLVMLGSASYEIHSRQHRRLRGLWGFGIGALSATLASVVGVMLALVALQPLPWWAPQVLIPILGIVLGNVMNRVSVTLDAFTSALVRECSAIEAWLALGATRYPALGVLQRNALRSGMIPIINQMSAAGIVTLPGMMTGQRLGGMPPFEAAKYQILMLLVLAGGAGVGAMGVSYWAVARVTDGRDRLRLDRLTSPRKGRA